LIFFVSFFDQAKKENELYKSMNECAIKILNHKNKK